MEPARVNRCRWAFWMALIFDTAGLLMLLLGALMDIFFSDLLIYSGGMGLLFSLLWWVFWYVGNLEVPLDELQDDDLGFSEERLTMAGSMAMEAEAMGRARRVRYMVRSFGRRFSSSFQQKSVHCEKTTEADSAVEETVTDSL